MSVYNDYMIKVSVAFVCLAELYCKLISQGVDDCCLKNKLIILAMYLDTIPRTGNENCLTTENVQAITNHINTIIGHPGLGTLTNINPLVVPTNVTAVVTASTVEPQAWNTTIGTAPTVISFNRALGTSGTSWGMSYVATTSGGEIIFPTISSRTASGFTVVASEDNVHFEGTAILKT